MADTKISALPASTTPLAGTEVVPVVQSGTTKNVSVANLTAGRSVATGQLTVSASGTGFGQGLQVKESNTTRNNNINITSDASGARFATDFNTGGTLAMRFTQYNTTVLELDASTNVKVNAGNLVIGTAAKGINFTANTPLAGMTSQLLNWYEAGTYTATLTPATSGTIPLNSNFDTLAYTRIGRQVTVTGQIQIFNPSSPVGTNFRLNLPFAPADLPEISGRGGFMLNYQNTAVSAYWEEGTAILYIIKDASTVANADNLYISFSYFTA